MLFFLEKPQLCCYCKTQDAFIDTIWLYFTTFNKAPRPKSGINFIFMWTRMTTKEQYFMTQFSASFDSKKPKWKLTHTHTHTLSCRSCIWGWRWTWRRTWWPCWRPPGSLSLWRSSCELWWRTCPLLCTHCGSRRLVGNASNSDYRTSFRTNRKYCAKVQSAVY